MFLLLATKLSRFENIWAFLFAIILSVVYNLTHRDNFLYSIPLFFSLLLTFNAVNTIFNNKKIKPAFISFSFLFSVLLVPIIKKIDFYGLFVGMAVLYALIPAINYYHDNEKQEHAVFFSSLIFLLAFLFFRRIELVVLFAFSYILFFPFLSMRTHVWFFVAVILGTIIYQMAKTGFPNMIPSTPQNLKENVRFPFFILLAILTIPLGNEFRKLLSKEGTLIVRFLIFMVAGMVFLISIITYLWLTEKKIDGSLLILMMIWTGLIVSLLSTDKIPFLSALLFDVILFAYLLTCYFFMR